MQVVQVVQVTQVVQVVQVMQGEEGGVRGCYAANLDIAVMVVAQPSPAVSSKPYPSDHPEKHQSETGGRS